MNDIKTKLHITMVKYKTTSSTSRNKMKSLLSSWPQFIFVLACVHLDLVNSGEVRLLLGLIRPPDRDDSCTMRGGEKSALKN